jgi:hypothetical protein
MITRKRLSHVSQLCSIFLLLPPALCHMEMAWPYPLHSKFNPKNDYTNIDYSMTNPLFADGSNFPCKGYQNDRPIDVTATYTAGETYNMTLSGTATHGGGSCQISLSYDNGATFRVIKSLIGGCPLTPTFDFTIPSYAPAGGALLAWSWQNYEGNREFYMNCAEIDIVSGTTRRQRRQTFSSFDQLPYIWKANLEGINDCTTDEGENPVYPNPGPDVVYDNGMSASDPPHPGVCDAPTPFGQTYEDLGDTDEPITTTPPDQPSPSTLTTTDVPTSTVPEPTSTTTTSETTISEAPTTTTKSLTTAPRPTYLPTDLTDYYNVLQPTGPPDDLNVVQRQATPSSETFSTTTLTLDCPDTVTVTVLPDSPSTTTITVSSMPSHYTTAVASACTGTSASCPCAAGYQCSELSPCTWACNAFPTPTSMRISTSRPASSIEPSITSSHSTWTRSRSSYSSRSTYTRSWSSHSTWTRSWTTRSQVVIIRTGTVVPIQSTPASTPENRQPYATGDLDSYLPCVPGTFICTDANTWQTCTNDGGSTWSYNFPRDVSDGMECLPYLSPYSGQTTQYRQQAKTPTGYYRDDRVVRARPDGDCNTDGSILCTDGGTMFDVCDQGGWVRMGPVAAGTTCQDGEIVAS